MDRFIPISTTNESIGLILLNNEQVFTLQDSVGLYDGKEKSMNQTSGTIYLTSHRLIYVDSLDPHFNSCYLDLSLIRQTEYYAGFLKSSPKITLFLSQPGSQEHASATTTRSGSALRDNQPSSTGTQANQKRDWRYKDKDKDQYTLFDDGNQLLENVNKFNSSWICETCGYSNQSSSTKCQLCGVPKSVSSSPFSSHLSSATTSSFKSRWSSSLNDPIARLKPNHSSNPQPDLSIGHSSASGLHLSNHSNSLDTESISIPTLQDEGPASQSTEGISCPICTFSNHPSMVKCEICDSPLTVSQANDQDPNSTPVITSRDKTVSLLRESEASRLKTSSPSQSSLDLPPSPSPRTSNQQQAPSTDSVKLSFRKGGDKAFYGTIKKTLISKDWLKDSNGRIATPATTLNLSSNRSTSEFASSSRPSSSHHLYRDTASSSTIDIDGRESNDPSRKGVGIEAILSTTQKSIKNQSNEMSVAFSDLESLMKKAKEMVDLAEELNSKLMKSKQRSTMSGERGRQGGLNAKEEEEAENIINNSLVRLGLKNPAFTKDMAKDLEAYHFGLAKELAGLLLSSESKHQSSAMTGINRKQPLGVGGGLMGFGKVLEKERESKELEISVQPEQSHREDSDLEDIEVEQVGRGIIGLDEVWCIWNRARGIALIPPQALRSASTHLPKITDPVIQLKTFKSGLTVLHTPRFNENNFNQRLRGRLRRIENEFSNTSKVEAHDPDPRTFGNGLSCLEISNAEGIPLNLSNEMIESCEMKFGSILRDDGGKQGTKWFSNRFQELSFG